MLWRRTGLQKYFALNSSSADVRTICPSGFVVRSFERSTLSPPSLAIGAINGIGSTAIAAWVTGLEVLYFSCIVLTVIAVARVAAALGLEPDEEGNSTQRLEIIYEVGAFSYALTLGTIAAIAMVLHADAAVEVLLIANALCYGVGICARNAGRPVIAIGQLTLVCLPIMVAALWVGGAAFIALFVTMVLLFPAMLSITLNVFKVLRDSIASAETSAQLADKMQTLARTDVVTGLANRAGLNHSMVEMLMEKGADDQLGRDLGRPRTASRKSTTCSATP